MELPIYEYDQGLGIYEYENQHVKYVRRVLQYASNTTYIPFQYPLSSLRDIKKINEKCYLDNLNTIIYGDNHMYMVL